MPYCAEAPMTWVTVTRARMDKGKEDMMRIDPDRLLGADAPAGASRWRGSVYLSVAPNSAAALSASR